GKGWASGLPFKIWAEPILKRRSKSNSTCVRTSKDCLLRAGLLSDSGRIRSKECTYWSLMKIEPITLREIHLRLKAPFETSFGVTQDRRILLVEVIADGVSGWGEVTAMETPSYNSETTDTAWHIISDFVAPAVVGRTIHRAAVFAILTWHIRRHEMA